MFRIGEFPEGLLGIFEKYHLSGLHMPAIACQQKQTGFAIYIYTYRYVPFPGYGVCASPLSGLTYLGGVLVMFF